MQRFGTYVSYFVIFVPFVVKNIGHKEF